jgi:hypothetical protein
MLDISLLYMYHLFRSSDLEIGLTTGVNVRAGKLTPLRYLIRHLAYPGILAFSSVVQRRDLVLNAKIHCTMKVLFCYASIMAEPKTNNSVEQPN